MKKIKLFLFILCGITATAQTIQSGKRGCGTEVPSEEWNNWFNKQVESFKQSQSANKNLSTNYTIPVIFHVVHGGQNVGSFPNLSQAQLNSQITILNNDYAGGGFNVGNFSSTGFAQSLVANCNINFCLALKNPSGTGLSEPGIERINYNSNGWSDPSSFTSLSNFKSYIENTIKPNTIWDPTRYLNIWVTDVDPNVGLLGYATFPPSSSLTGLTGGGLGTTTTDGVWCWAKAVGDVGTIQPNYNKGRTATHEIGHWLGLRHIWGDSNCGTDYCNDTPTQLKENTGCPSYPNVTCLNGPLGDMFMNFMDYCNDPCLYMFTNDQRSRMQTAMANSPLRNQLTASSATLCGSQQTFCSYTVSNFTNTDTLTAYRRATAAASDVSCLQGSGKAGYITGSNCYGDKEKAEFISTAKYSSAVNPVITGVIVLFFQYGNSGTDGTGNVSLNLYNGSSASSAPGSLIGSKTENLSTIAATTNTEGVSYCGDPNLAFGIPLIMPFKFTFASPIPAPSSGGFFASVVLPTSANDTVAILDKRTGTSNTAWEKWSDNSWNSMKVAWGNVRNYNLAILPIIECGPAGYRTSTILSDAINIFPNPSTGNFNVVTTFATAQNIDVKVYNILGQIIYSDKKKEMSTGNTEINLSDQTSGIYFVELTAGQEKITKRILIDK